MGVAEYLASFFSAHGEELGTGELVAHHGGDDLETDWHFELWMSDCSMPVATVLILPKSSPGPIRKCRGIGYCDFLIDLESGKSTYEVIQWYSAWSSSNP